MAYDEIVTSSPGDEKPKDFTPEEKEIIFGTPHLTAEQEFEEHVKSQVGDAYFYAGRAGVDSLDRSQVIAAVRSMIPEDVRPEDLDQEEGEALILRIGHDARKGFDEWDTVTGRETAGEALAKIQVLMRHPDYARSKAGDRIFEDVRILHRLAFDRNR